MIKLFEEYRLFSGDPGNWGTEDSEKDPNEPFFLGKKREYKKAKEEAEQEERLRQSRERVDVIVSRELEKSIIQRPMVEKYIEMMKRPEETVLKSNYNRQDENSYRYMTYAVMLKDKTKIFATYSSEQFTEKEPDFMTLSINKTRISTSKEHVKNPEDPYDEENWNENVKSPAEILADLIKDYVEENELVI